MTSTSKPIVFFGTEDFSLASLKALIDGGFYVAAVITKPDSKKGRGQTLTPPAVKVLAEQHSINVLQPAKLAEIAPFIESLTDPVGVLVSYGKIVPQSIIDLFKPGIINVHPSLLPRYRGPSPIESAIANGDAETGVSIMQLSAQMDAGPVYTVEKFSLNDDETKPELYQTLATVGAQLLTRTLPQILDGSLQPVAQINQCASYCALLNKSDALLVTTELTAAQAERRIRAHLGFPKTKIVHNDTTLIITKAHVSRAPKTNLDKICRDKLYLCIDELVAPSGRTMSAEDYLRGYAA